MKIYPAIDLINGQVVRLAQGRFADKTVYASSPFEIASRFHAEGATYLHVIDLDGAKEGRPMQVELIRDLAREIPLKLQVGGGIRSLDHVQALIEAGVDRVIIGSLAIQDPKLAKRIFETFGGEHITLGLDIMLSEEGHAKVATHGWQEVSSSCAFEVLDRFVSMGLSQVLCTDISRDGMMTGPNFALYRKIQQKFPHICLLASGGMSKQEDLVQLRRDGIGGAIIGKALYEGSIQLKEALLC